MDIGFLERKRLMGLKIREMASRDSGSPLRFKGTRVMTLPGRVGAESVRVRDIPLIETERLVLRAPRFEDAKTIATLVNDRRIAENTLRIPHPYGIADAEHFITGANATRAETVFLVTRRGDTVLGACGVVEQGEEAPEIGY
jgi:RimJ/RimL family protein N-acetyltransferase